MDIDFVIPWVDGNDPAWRREKNKYMGIDEPDAGDDRYRDMRILKYWFRAVEKYAPWVNRIHFVTWGHLPDWLNTQHPKLHIVSHKDYIPEEYLPTFSSHPIELNFHRIPGLSEHFVYFNDDMLLNGPVEPEFFFRRGLPCDCFQTCHIPFHPEDVHAHCVINSLRETNRKYSYAKIFLKHPTKIINPRYSLSVNIQNLLRLGNIHEITGLNNHHLAAAYRLQSFCDVWESSDVLLKHTSSKKFRSPFDMNQYIFRYEQLCSGAFYPVSEKNRGKVFAISNQNTQLINALQDEEIKQVCINDTPYPIDFERAVGQIIAAYEKKLPKKSMFEKIDF